MADASPDDELQRLRTRHALGEVTDEELAAAEARLQQQREGGPSAASLTTRFEAMSRGEVPTRADRPVDTTDWRPDVVATGTSARKGPPLALAALVVVALAVLILAAVLAA